MNGSQEIHQSRSHRHCCWINLLSHNDHRCPSYSLKSNKNRCQFRTVNSKLVCWVCLLISLPSCLFVCLTVCFVCVCVCYLCMHIRVYVCVCVICVCICVYYLGMYMCVSLLCVYVCVEGWVGYIQMITLAQSTKTATFINTYTSTTLYV